MQASMAETSTSKPDEFAERVSELPTVLPQTQRMSSFLLAREERLQLEKERLERQKKRLREGPEKRDDKGKGRATTEDEIVHDVSERPGKKARTNGLTSNQSESSSSQGDELFWSGIVRQIANRFVDKDKNTRPFIRLSEIITQVYSSNIDVDTGVNLFTYLERKHRVRDHRVLRVYARLGARFFRSTYTCDISCAT